METATIADVLGGREVLGTSVDNPDDLARLVRNGLPVGAVAALGQRLSVTHTALSRKLGIPAGRRSRLTPAESDRTARIARVYVSAVQSIGDEGRAREWLRIPNRALGGERPVDLLDTDIGAQMVHDVLGRIAYGVYS